MLLHAIFYHFTDKQVILLFDSSLFPSSYISSPLLSFCQTVNLSLISPLRESNNVSIVDRIYASNTSMKYLYSLLLVLSIIPTCIHWPSDLESHSVLAFLISSLHCNLYYQDGNTDGNTLRHLSTLINCLHLINVQRTNSIEATITSLRPFIKHQYSIDDNILDMFLSANLLDETSIIVTGDGVPLPVPNSHVQLQQYGDHVTGIIDGLHKEEGTVTRYTTCIHVRVQLHTRSIHEYVH